MQERDVLAFGAKTRLVIDETNGCGSTTVEGAFEIVHDKTHVMDSRPAFGDELADG